MKKTNQQTLNLKNTLKLPRQKYRKPLNLNMEDEIKFLSRLQSKQELVNNQRKYIRSIKNTN